MYVYNGHANTYKYSSNTSTCIPFCPWSHILYLCTRFALYIPCPLNAEPAPSSSVEFFLTERLARVSTCVYELGLMSYLISKRVITNCAWEIESLRCQIEFTSSSASTTFSTRHALSSLHPTPSSETDPNMGSIINPDGVHYTLLYYVSIPKPFSALAYQILKLWDGIHGMRWLLFKAVFHMLWHIPMPSYTVLLA